MAHAATQEGRTLHLLAHLGLRCGGRRHVGLDVHPGMPSVHGGRPA